jgi:hypothetical protein
VDIHATAPRRRSPRESSHENPGAAAFLNAVAIAGFVAVPIPAHAAVIPCEDMLKSVRTTKASAGLGLGTIYSSLLSLAIIALIIAYMTVNYEPEAAADAEGSM